MAAQKLIDNETVSLTYHPEAGIVHHEFKKFVFGDPFRTVLMQGCDVLAKNHATKWLSDDRGNSALGKDDTEWAQTVVLPVKVVGQLNMKQWVKLYEGLGINSQVFDDPEKAMAWLKAQ
jgi:hypothetical protein